MSAPNPAPFRVGAVVRNKAMAAGAAHWIDDLPHLIASVERDWQLTVGRPWNVRPLAG